MPRERLRVTHVVHDLNGGGMESLVAAMAERFAGSDVAMSVITLGGRPGIVGSAIRHRLAQYHVIKPVPVASMVVPLKLVRRLRQTRADVVHVHSGAWFKGALAARMAGVRCVIYTEHGREHHDPPLARWLDRRAARWTDIVVPVSERLRHYLHERVGVPLERLYAIENAIDTEAFAPGPAPGGLRRELGLADDALVVGSIGRLEPVKAYERLIAAVARIRARGRLNRPTVAVICGDGSQRSALEATASSLGVADAVRLPGWVARAAEMYRLFDLFVLTSVSEGTSVSLLEAMATGIAPVVTDVGANAELLGPDLASHHLVRSEQITSIAECIEALLAQPERRAHAGRLARERAVARYGFDRFMTEYRRLYEVVPVGPNR